MFSMTLTLFSVDLDEVQRYRQLWLDPLAFVTVHNGDLADKAKHLIWVCDDEVAGIASIVPDMKKVGADNINWRLRAIAIEPARRREGKGEEFLLGILAFAKRKNRYPLYGASRADSIALYEKLGAVICDKPYELADQGLHVDFVFAD